MGRQNQADDEIDLRAVFVYIHKHRRMVIAFTFLGILLAGILYSVSYFLNASTEMYSIRSTMAVTTQASNGKFSSNNDNPNSSDIHLAEDMVDSVIYVCTSDAVLSGAAKELELLGVTPEMIRKKLKFTQYKETQIIQSELLWYDKEEGIRILDAINEVLPDVLVQTLKLGNVAVINMPAARVYQHMAIGAKQAILIAAAFFFASLAFCVLDMLIHPTITSELDVEEKLGSELYACIPREETYMSKRHMFAEPGFRIPPLLEEAYSSAAYTLSYQMEKAGGTIACFTSSTAQEGKTTLIANVGIQLAKQHKKVLLVDFDLRKPSLTGLFIKNGNYEHSLNGIVRSHIDPQDAVVEISPELHILPTYLEKNPLIFSPAIADVMKRFAENYDIVLVDTAPIGHVSDTLFIKRIADMSFFVIRYDSVWLSVIRRNIAKLRAADIEISGCFINQMSRMADAEQKYYRQYMLPYYKDRQAALEGISPASEDGMTENGEGKKKRFGIFKKK